ncbi:MAG: hypothetical protein JRI23_11955 [Deltaproteobacteria bacterium]|jgi:transposase-like protein|nr:hypothetical protein [Deltaproteobacteria bacterium]MBW2532422.1 hypothetical protein [Deltaproteobacteria bacterium]
MRLCGSCGGELIHESGWEQSARERAGNAVEVDTFRCAACGRNYRHRVDERFSGDIHHWWLQTDTADWELLEPKDWPKLR